MPDVKSIAAMFGASETATFLGLPACTDVAKLDARVALLGVPCATPYPSVGAYCAAAPQAIRAAISGYAGRSQHMDFDLGGPVFPDDVITACDLGDLELDDTDAAQNRRRIEETVRAIAGRGAVPVLIGGDDSIPIPMIAALDDQGPLTIVQIDAHIDWRDKVDGERWGLSSTMRRASEMSHVRHIIQVGQRAIGSARPQDYADAVAWGAEFVSARDVHAQGIAPVLEHVPDDANVVIAFDCDALDPSIMPGVIGRAPGGMTYWQAVDLLHGIAGKARIVAFDLVEFMPQRDVDGIGALNAARILVNVIGLVARQAPAGG